MCLRVGRGLPGIREQLSVSLCLPLHAAGSRAVQISLSGSLGVCAWPPRTSAGVSHFRAWFGVCVCISSVSVQVGGCVCVCTCVRVAWEDRGQEDWQDPWGPGCFSGGSTTLVLRPPWIWAAGPGLGLRPWGKDVGSASRSCGLCHASAREARPRGGLSWTRSPPFVS